MLQLRSFQFEDDSRWRVNPHETKAEQLNLTQEPGRKIQITCKFTETEPHFLSLFFLRETAQRDSFVKTELLFFFFFVPYGVLQNRGIE